MLILGLKNLSFALKIVSIKRKSLFCNGSLHRIKGNIPVNNVLLFKGLFDTQQNYFQKIFGLYRLSPVSLRPVIGLH